MYHDDGSFKVSEFNIETSLIDLLEFEKEVVTRLNNSICAYETVRKQCGCVTSYRDDVLHNKQKLLEVREKIRYYVEENLGIKTNASTIQVNLSRDDDMASSCEVNLTRNSTRKKFKRYG